MLKVINGITIILIVVCLFLCGCNNSVNTNDYSSYTLDLNKSSSSNSPTQVIPEFNSQAQQEYEKELHKNNHVNKDNIVDKSLPITQYGLMFEDIQIYKSKDLPEGVNMEDVMYFYDDIADENGRITMEFTYLFITMTVTNLKEKDTTVCWNSHGPSLLDENDYVISVNSLIGWEACYRSGEKNNGAKQKNHYSDDIKPKEKINITIGYFIDDEYVNSDNLYYAPATCSTEEIYMPKELMYYKI